MTNPNRFTWIPLYRELADLLCNWEDRQGELIALLEDLRSDGVKVTPLNDQDKDGSSFLIREIDPFTFFGTFNRQIRETERLAILKGVKASSWRHESFARRFCWTACRK